LAFGQPARSQRLREGGQGSQSSPPPDFLHHPILAHHEAQLLRSSGGHTEEEENEKERRITAALEASLRYVGLGEAMRHHQKPPEDTYRPVDPAFHLPDEVRDELGWCMFNSSRSYVPHADADAHLRHIKEEEEDCVVLTADN